MEVYSGKPCGFCKGSGVNATKEEYDRWDRILENAQFKITHEGKPAALFQLAKHQVEKEMEKHPMCNWCDGQKILGKKEDDVDV